MESVEDPAFMILFTPHVLLEVRSPNTNEPHWASALKWEYNTQSITVLEITILAEI